MFAMEERRPPAPLLPPSRRWMGPTLPAPDLLTQQVHDRGNHIYVMEGFLSPDECLAWIQHGEEEGFQECFQEGTRDYAFRKQARIAFESMDIAQQIFDRIRLRDKEGGLLLLPKSVDGLTAQGCSSNIRLYRYSAGDAFGRHVDESNETTQDGVLCESKFTALIYLNGSGSGSSVAPTPTATPTAPPTPWAAAAAAELELPSMQGGETLFYRSHTAAQPTYKESPKVGNLLLHRHGAKCLSHEAKAVTGGVKYVLRTDVLYSDRGAAGAGQEQGQKQGQRGGAGSRKRGR